jgi:hypothetical protein
MGDDTAPDGVVSIQSCVTDDDGGSQGLIQASVSEGNELQGAIHDVVLHQSPFELEGDKNMQLKSELVVVKEILDERQI